MKYNSQYTGRSGTQFSPHKWHISPHYVVSMYMMLPLFWMKGTKIRFHKNLFITALDQSFLLNFHSTFVD